jgi:two-component system, LytTR family, response regulator
MTQPDLRTILVDDEPSGLNTMRSLLQFNCPEINIVATASAVDEAVEKIKSLQPDLIFLDISMPVKDGFSLLKELKDFNFEVIFVTAHNEFLLDAFHFSAIDYLLKPVEDDLLIDAVKRARKRIMEKAGNKNFETFLHNVQQKHSSQNMRLCLASPRGFEVVELNDVLYVESSGNYTNLYFSDHSSLCSSKPLHEYEELLADAGFIRVHKSFLVNLSHVKGYIRGEGGFIKLSNGNSVEVSRRKKEFFLAKMKEFYKI